MIATTDERGTVTVPAWSRTVFFVGPSVASWPIPRVVPQRRTQAAFARLTEPGCSVTRPTNTQPRSRIAMQRRPGVD